MVLRIIFFSLLCFNVYARNSVSCILDEKALLGYAVMCAPDSVNPKVFVLGEDDILEARLNKIFDKNILRAFDDDSEKTFQAWLDMMTEMEKYADHLGIDLKGINAFATFYWDKKGNIRHIGYSLKAKSRYFKQSELERFFQKFMAKYKMTPINKLNFQHTFTISLPFPKIYKK